MNPVAFFVLLATVWLICGCSSYDVGQGGYWDDTGKMVEFHISFPFQTFTHSGVANDDSDD